jgi:site-specific DNA-cytosine methylase
MNLHPEPLYRPIPVKVVILRSLEPRSQRINPWIPEDEPAATICSVSAGYRLKEGEIKPIWQMYRVLTGKGKKKHFGLVKIDPERPCPTITKSTGGTTTGLVHPYEIRRLSIDEIKALASFPEAFRMEGSYNERWARIGNSVPPLFMRAIAESVHRYLLGRA